MTARLRPRLAMARETVVAVEVPDQSPKCELVLDRSYNTFHVGGPRIDYVYIGVSKTESNKFEGPVHLIAVRLDPYRSGAASLCFAQAAQRLSSGGAGGGTQPAPDKAS